MHRPGGSKHPPHEADWIWAESGAGPFCCEAQADGVPCFELGRRCETCELAYRWYVTWIENRHE